MIRLRKTRAPAIRAVAGLAVLLLAAGPAAAGPREPVRHVAKVDASVLARSAPEAPATFFVLLKSQAELGRASTLAGHAERTRYVYEAKKADADRSQAGLRAMLAERKAEATPFWIVNALKVTGDKKLLLDIANRPEVEKIVPEPTYRLVKPVNQQPKERASEIEWNIDRIRAPEVWKRYGIRGEGVVVGTIDTGAQFDHPAIARQYRGAADGKVDHAYHWFDPSNVCGNPSTAPCDNIGHGTHVLGTVLGDDGKGNQTGVAPGAKWVAAKGCESDFCSSSALLSSGQWMLAPTDPSGNNPRPELAPNIVNNSWTGPAAGDPFFQKIVDTWSAAGILPVFAAGNDGPSCRSTRSPGDLSNAYSVGAFDRNNAIAAFSGRGPGGFGEEIKPDISAPGAQIRSSVPGGGYAEYNGTSMAAPHVAGTAALIWSAAPVLRGQLGISRELVDGAAAPTDDQTCGGTSADNNVWGRGRLDALSALTQAPRGPVGALDGAVREGATPLADATIRVDGPLTRTARTNEEGKYSLPFLSAGQYTVTVARYGYLTQTAQVVITENVTAVRDFSLALAPKHAISGRVTDEAGQPVPGTTVSLPGTPAPRVTTDAQGAYRLADIPEGRYDLEADRGRCLLPHRVPVTVDGDKTVDVGLYAKTDNYGHRCATVPPSWQEANTLLPLNGDDAMTEIKLPFPVNLYQQSYRSARVSTNGFLSFTATTSYNLNAALPGPAEPNTLIAPFWDDLVVDAEATVRTETVGAAPNRQVVVEWRNVAFTGKPANLRVSFQVVLAENGPITFQYKGIGDDPGQRGGSATVGVEDETGTQAVQYGYESPVLADDTAVLLRVPDTGLTRGTVTDANDGKPVANADITVSQAGVPDQTVRSDADGVYQARVRDGELRLRVERQDYVTYESQIQAARADEVVVHDVVLRTAQVTARPGTLEVVVPQGETRDRTLTLTNSGSAEASWQMREAGGGAIQRPPQAARPGRTAAFDANARTSKGFGPGSSGPAPASAPGQVLRSWPTTGLQLGWGAGAADGGVWVSDASIARVNAKFAEDGARGPVWPASWAGDWAADMARVPGKGLVCQVNVGGDNGIHCWDPNTGEVKERIAGAFGWTGISQRGLAYRPDDDSFYVGGWNEGTVYHVRGLSHPDRGTVIGQCKPSDPNISGLAWNSAFGMLWAATNGQNDTVYGLNPDTCQTVKTIAPPDAVPYSGAGLETDVAGNLWVVSQGNPSTMYLLDSGVPDFSEVPWLRTTPEIGKLAPGESGRLTVTVDATNLRPGVYGATSIVLSNSGRGPVLAVPIRVIVPGYQAGFQAGAGPHTDALGDTWAADRPFLAGGSGYLDNNLSKVVRAREPIRGTDEPELYRTQREGAYEYRFDNVPNGVYAVELKFAELKRIMPNTRLFDVICEDQLFLPALDVANTAGVFTALDRTIYVKVTDGQLNVRLISRKGEPIVNSIRVTERPDRVG
ncbi:S8 family serine peptidase [Amycolatopsis anabasis]|uniref:S8 family serine peptidase n=1 Tax=Amycolatopsis anabasis TaxID=1840409 RepID=UPI00131ACF30|nr:S8 family serine peptidase [Amycolatopsis anabasis]